MFKVQPVWTLMSFLLLNILLAHAQKLTQKKSHGSGGEIEEQHPSAFYYRFIMLRMNSDSGMGRRKLARTCS